MTRGKTRGRPRKHSDDKRYQIRMADERATSEARLQAWSEAAAREGRDLASWIRWTLDNAALERT